MKGKTVVAVAAIAGLTVFGSVCVYKDVDHVLAAAVAGGIVEIANLAYGWIKGRQSGGRKKT